MAIDDFGTGHSSLARLRDLPVEVLKIDRSFVDGLGTEPEDSAVVAAILASPTRSACTSIAEGVETPLRPTSSRLGCRVPRAGCGRPPCPRELRTCTACSGHATRAPRPREREPGR